MQNVGQKCSSLSHLRSLLFQHSGHFCHCRIHALYGYFRCDSGGLPSRLFHLAVAVAAPVLVGPARLEALEGAAKMLSEEKCGPVFKNGFWTC